MRRIIGILLALSLGIGIASVYADTHEVRYTPSNESYGACRAQFPYSHVEDCAMDYDTLMMFWIGRLQGTYETCNDAEAAGLTRQQGSIGTGMGFPIANLPNIANGDGDDVVCEIEPSVAPQSTPTAQAEPTPEVTPTVKEFLFDMAVCDRIRFEGSMLWGQAPGVIYSGDPRITGRLETGDYLRFLMPEPNADGEIRIQVYPHDYRTVGQTDNRVWIDYGSLIQYRLELLTFICED